MLNYINEEIAMVDIRGIKKEISMGLLPEKPEVGSYVLIHTGYAITALDEEEARKTLEMWDVLEAASDGYQY